MSIPVPTYESRLQELRIKCGLSQQDFGVMLLTYVKSRGVKTDKKFGRQTVTWWESGRVRPSIKGVDMDVLIADFFGVSLDWLHGYTSASMVHCQLRHTVERARQEVTKRGKIGRKAAAEFIRLLLQNATFPFDEAFYFRRLGICGRSLEADDIDQAALDNLSDLTGIAGAYWYSGDPADMEGECPELGSLAIVKAVRHG